MNLLQGIFGFNGRVNRYTFWVNLIICLIANFILSQLFVRRYVSIYDFQEHTSITNKPIYFTAVALIGLRALSISVRRWHDLDKTGWFAALNFFAIANSTELIDLPDDLYWGGLLLSAIISLAILGFQGFVPGDPESNQYGPLPEEGLAWVVPASQSPHQTSSPYTGNGFLQGKSPQVSAAAHAANSLTAPFTSYSNSGSRAAEIGAAIGAVPPSARTLPQSAGVVTAAGSPSSAIHAQIQLGKFAPTLNICLNEQTLTDIDAIFYRTRLLMLFQLNQHSMGIGHIETNTRSSDSTLFEASVVPAGEVTMTRSQHVSSDSEDRDLVQQCVHLAFSNLKAPRNAVDGMLLAIATSLQTEFSELTIVNARDQELEPPPRVDEPLGITPAV